METTDHSDTLYRTTEATRRFLSAPFRRQTYRNLLFLLLAFPLGIVSFTGVITGVTLGLGLLVTVVGVPILLGTLLGARYYAVLEGRLIASLIGVNVSAPVPPGALKTGNESLHTWSGLSDAVKQLLLTPVTWASVAFALIKFVFGLISFCAVVIAGSVSATLLAAPFVYDDKLATLSQFSGQSFGQYRIGQLVVDTLPEAILVAVAGLPFLLLSLNVLNALSRFQVAITRRLLDAGEQENGSGIERL